MVSRDGWLCIDIKHHLSGKGQVRLSLLNSMAAHYFHGLTAIHQPKPAVFGHTEQIVFFPKKRTEIPVILVESHLLQIMTEIKKIKQCVYMCTDVLLISETGTPVNRILQMVSQ